MRNTILLTKDVLRKDYLRCYNPNSVFDTPNIDKLASQGTIFEKYYCSAPSSGMAVTSMFSGLEPHQLSRKTFGEVETFKDSRTLFTELEDKGIKTFVTWTSEFKHLAYAHSKVFDKRTEIFYAPRGGSTPVEPQNHAFSKVDKEQSDYKEYNLVDYFLEIFDKIQKSSDNPWFLWCHTPHVFSPRKAYGSDIDIFDSFVGQIVDKFDADLFVSADHAHSKVEHGKIVYGFHLNEGTINIPLIIPNFLGESEIKYPVGQTQLKNLILSRSLEKRKFIYSDTQYYEQPNRKIMILNENYKYIYNKFDSSEELYDLEFDSSENINLLIDKFPDPERSNYYEMDKILHYPHWDSAEKNYYILSNERKRLWRTGSFFAENWSRIKKLRILPRPLPTLSSNRSTYIYSWHLNKFN